MIDDVYEACKSCESSVNLTLDEITTVSRICPMTWPDQGFYLWPLAKAQSVIVHELPYLRYLRYLGMHYRLGMA